MVADSKIPNPLVIAVATSAGVNRAEALEDRFINGLKSAGVGTDGSPTATLSIATTVVPPRGATNQSFGFGWATNTSPHAPPIRNARIVISTTLVGIQLPGISWLALINCTVNTNDRGLLVEDFGRAIGRMVGRTSPAGTAF